MRRNKEKKMYAMLGLVVGLSLTATAGTVFAADKDAVMLDEVKVESSALENYLVTTQVITAEDIKAKEAKTLPDLLRDVPGLIVSTGAKSNTTVSIRGAGTDQTRIYIDGVLMNALSSVSTNSALDLSQISVEQIAKIEIIKGPGPVQYGTDYKGGVILITTKDGKGFAGTKVNIAFGAHDKLMGSASTAGTEGKLNYYIDMGGEHSDGYRDNMKRDTKYVDTHLKWELGADSRLAFDAGYSITDKEIMNGVDPYSGNLYSPNIKWAYPSGTSGKMPAINWKYKDWEKTNLALDYQQKVNPVFNYNIKLFRVTDDNNLWVYRTKTGFNDWYESKWKSTMKGVEIQTNWNLAKNNSLLFGGRYATTDWDEWDSIYTNWSSSNDKRTSYYLQDTWLPGKNTTVTAGVRYDKDKPRDGAGNSKETTAVDPVANIVHRLNDKDTLRFSVGRMHLFPTLSQLYGNMGGNSGLSVERGVNYEMGWKHQIDKTSLLDAAVFYNDISDRIYTPDKKSTPYKNISSTTIKGVELQAEKKFSNKLRGFVNCTWMQAQDKNNGVTSDAAGIPKLTMNYGLTFTENNHEILLEGHAFHKRATGDSNYPDIPGYYTMDLQYKWFPNKDQTYYIRLNNLLNKKYQEELYYPAEGFHIMAGAEFSL
jgi:outer membrane cobalamin receptor